MCAECQVTTDGILFNGLMVYKPGIIYCLVANATRILVAKRLRDGNFVQYAKKILASGVDQDGDHCRSYYDKDNLFAFHVLVRI